MMEEKCIVIRNWLLKSKSDLDTARDLIPLAHLDTAIYHCQQCAEKCAKAGLAYWDIEIPKTHNIVELLGLLMPTVPSISSWLPAAQILTPLGVKYRYPDNDMLPLYEEVTEALTLASQFYAFILSTLPVQTHP
jgi:HEPN domain-containing protein